jgi:hypothetical protein
MKRQNEAQLEPRRGSGRMHMALAAAVSSMRCSCSQQLHVLADLSHGKQDIGVLSFVGHTLSEPTDTLHMFHQRNEISSFWHIIARIAHDASAAYVKHNLSSYCTLVRLRASRTVLSFQQHIWLIGHAGALKYPYSIATADLHAGIGATVVANIACLTTRRTPNGGLGPRPNINKQIMPTAREAASGYGGDNGAGYGF